MTETGKYLKPPKGMSNQNIREGFLLGLEWFALDPIRLGGVGVCVVCVGGVCQKLKQKVTTHDQWVIYY